MHAIYVTGHFLENFLNPVKKLRYNKDIVVTKWWEEKIMTQAMWPRSLLP